MRSRFEGCLLGLALGDAMAAIGIGETRQTIAQKYGQIDGPRGGGKLNLDPGEYTDEGQMMVSVLESICTLRSFKPDNIAHRFIGWLNSHPKDMGRFTRHVLERMRDGERWQEASEGAAYDSSLQVAGSASLIYGTPVGLLRHNNLDKLVEDSITCSRITHWDERCTHGSVLVNYTIKLLLDDEKNVLKKVQAFAHDKDDRLQEALSKVEGMKFEDIDTSGYAPSTLQAAFYFLLNSESLESGLKQASTLGGESPDAIGALAGAFLGAKFGRKAISEVWIYQLIGNDRIDVLASRLQELSLL
ncbi:MAG: ADP-ribosylglycohydrolase family protein [Acidobacteria bacterium]|nr:ADP-ribosylglycohydrolase family protein [Acidobacteriota bacterium]